ncbi:MAG: hypothetical protein AB7V27_19385 [Candidatus Binatia bacterium]
MLERVGTAVDEKAKQLHRELRLLGRHPDYARLGTALCAQPGIGALGAIRLVLELGDMARCPSSDSAFRRFRYFG